MKNKDKNKQNINRQDVVKRFNKRIPLSQDILAKISKIDQFQGLWQGSLRLSPQILGRLKAFVVITSTGASTRIEGAKMTDDEIARFLRGLKEKAPKGRDQEEVAGYADLIGRVFDGWKTMKLTEGWIQQFHSILLNFSEKDKIHKGKYKDGDNTVIMENDKKENVVLFNPTHSYLVKGEMLEAIEWTNEQLESHQIHPLLVIANFIFEFLAIHPFSDGNGRVSRALTNFLLLQAGYSYVPYVSLDEIIEQTKVDYYLALRATQRNHGTDHEDIKPWVDYFLTALTEQAERARKIMDEDQPEKLLSEKQKGIFELFMEDKAMGVAEVVALLGGKIERETIKQSLSRLVKLRLLERVGQGRGTRYLKIYNHHTDI
jgi:Fic family protein